MYPKPHDTTPTTAAEYQALADDVALEAKHVEGMKEQLNQKLLVAKAGTVRVGPPGMPLSELMKQAPLAGVEPTRFSFAGMDLQPWQLTAMSGLAGGGLEMTMRLADEERRAADEVIEGRVLPDGPWKLPTHREEQRQPAGGGIFGMLMDELSTAFGEFGRSVVDGLVAMSKATADAGLVPEETPSDPRAKALWMKQHRGHGPETPQSWRKR